MDLNPLDWRLMIGPGYAPTYYPNAANLADAQRVTIGVGQTLNDINFALSPTRLARLTGSGVDSEGKPMAGAFVSMISARQAQGQRLDRGPGEAGRKLQRRERLARRLHDPRDEQHGRSGSGANELVEARVTVAGEDIDGVRLRRQSVNRDGPRHPYTGGRGGRTPTNLSSLQLVASVLTPALLNQPSTARVEPKTARSR